MISISDVQHDLVRARPRHADHDRAFVFVFIEDKIAVINLACDKPRAARTAGARLTRTRRIDAMCARHGFLSVLEPNGLMDTPLLGTLEQRPPVAPPRRPNRSVSEAVAPFAADV